MASLCMGSQRSAAQMALRGFIWSAPEEWLTAATALRAIGAIDAPRGYFVREVFAFAVLFALGALVTHPFSTGLSLAAARDPLLAILAGLMAVGALLAGFMLTLMLSSGRIEQLETLSYEETAAYAHRLKLLLRSQACTLTASILMTFFALAWLISIGVDLGTSGQQILAGALGGYSCVSIIRCVLIPLQIYEIHEASLDDAVEVKRKEASR